MSLSSAERSIVVASHPRSGTHLTIDTLRRHFAPCKAWVYPWETVHHLYLDLDRLQQAHPQRLTIDKAERLLTRCERPIIKTHSQPRLKEFKGREGVWASSVLAKARVLYVVRDPRDVMCSAYLWCHPDPNGRPSFASFLRVKDKGRNRIQRWVEHVERWSSVKGVKVLPMEKLKRQLADTLAELATLVGMEPLGIESILPPKREVYNRCQDYARRLLRKYDSTAVPGRLSAEPSPDWAHIATRADNDFMSRYAGRMMERLGYSYPAVS